jgi:6-phosphogluconate dehydrogenase
MDLSGFKINLELPKDFLLYIRRGDRIDQLRKIYRFKDDDIIIIDYSNKII